MSYYENGKLKDLTYPNNYAIRHHYYNSQLSKIQDANDKKIIYLNGNSNQFGITKAILGNGITVYNQYNEVGSLESIWGSKYGDIYGEDKINLSYTYDDRGNVASRTDHLLSTKTGGFKESFQYDYLNRVANIHITSSAVGNYNNGDSSYQYDTLGNLKQKGSLKLSYYDSRPHAVSSIKTSSGTIRSYRYDANGNVIDDGKRTISYNQANKPIEIKQDGKTINFAYGANGARYKKEFDNQWGYTHYIGKLYELSQPNINQTEYTDKNFIYFGDKLIAVKKRTGARVIKKIETNYMHQDNLGNVIAISNEYGGITNRRSYTPFGEIREVLYKEATYQAKQLTTSQMLTATTNRGFTGHEHIEDTGLIHMNGRVYDPTIGRFLSADPHIQAPHDTQSYNRYSYVKNNPLNYTDPSGYFFKKLFKWVKKNIKTIVAIAVTVTIGIFAAPALGTLLGSNFLGAVATGALAGGASGAIMTGSVKGALNGAMWGAVAAGAAYGVAQLTSSVMGVSPADAHSASFFKAGMQKAAAFKAVAHGLSRAAIAKLHYGTAKGAFLSGFVTSGFSAGGGEGAVGAIKMAIVGGTVAEIGGGKFANGAMGSAFQYLFNDLAVSIDKNIELVKTISNGSKGSAVIDWIFRVKGGGVWDYKSIIGLELGEDLGNFNYGATGSALGFSKDTLLEAAGFVQIVSGTARLDYINSNFDDPRDQAMIKLGIEYYKYYKENK